MSAFHAGDVVFISSAGHPHDGTTGTLVSRDRLTILGRRKWRVRLDEALVAECYADEDELLHVETKE